MAVITKFDQARRVSSRTHVGAVAATEVLRLNRAQQIAAEQDERQRIRQMIVLELGLAFQKMYVLLGIEETDRLGPWVQSAKREEHKMKNRIKGE